MPNRLFGISDTRDNTYRFWIMAGGIRDKERKKEEEKKKESHAHPPAPIGRAE